MADSIDRLSGLLRAVKNMMELDSELYDSVPQTLTDDEVLIAALECYTDRRHFYTIYKQAQAELIKRLYQELAQPADHNTRSAELDGKINALQAIDSPADSCYNNNKKEQYDNNNTEIRDAATGL